MNFSNGFPNARMPSTEYIALLHEGSSRRNVSKSLERLDGKKNTRYYEASNSSSYQNSYSKSPSIRTRSSRAPWLNAFLHKSSQYVDFLATEEARNKTHPSTTNLESIPATVFDSPAPSYAQMRRISSRPLLCRANRVTPFSLEWALDELVTADKWLHEKYGPRRQKKDPARGQSGDARADNANRFRTERVPIPAVPRKRRVRGLDVVAESPACEVNEGANDKHRPNTMPRNLKELFAIGKKKTPSSCSLPDSSRMEVISRILTVEG